MLGRGAIFATVMFIVQTSPCTSTANSFVPKFGKLKIVYEKSNLIDTRGDWQRKPFDYHQKNYVALKKARNFYGELGIGYDFSIGYEQTYQKIEARLVIPYDKNFLHNYKPPTYVYDELGRPQLNEELEQFYYENKTFYRIKKFSFSWYDKQIFIKKKLYDSDSSALTYQLGYIFQSKGSYIENGITSKNSNALVFDSPLMGKRRIGGHQINHELFIRKYLKLSEKGPREYYDLDFKLVTDPDHKLLKAKLETGIGFNLTRDTLVELKGGFETKSFTINRDLLTARVTLYKKMSRYYWLKTEILRKYSKGVDKFDDVKITAITTGIEVKI